jgi:DNA-binding NarL/FixJ family response regulator
MSRVRVVLADDATALRELLVRALQKDERIEVVGTAGDGEEALEVLAREQPDVLVLDVSMPKLDGLGVLRRLAAGGPHCPVVILTGYASGDLADTCSDAGAAAYIEKGAAMAEVRDTIVKVAGGA